MRNLMALEIDKEKHLELKVEAYTIGKTLKDYIIYLIDKGRGNAKKENNDNCGWLLLDDINEENEILKLEAKIQEQTISDLLETIHNFRRCMDDIKAIAASTIDPFILLEDLCEKIEGDNDV